MGREYRFVCQSARAAITKYHRLGDFNNRNLFLTALEAGSPRSKCQQVWFLLRAVREESVPSISPWLVDGLLLPVSSHHLPSACRFASRFPPFHKDTNHSGLGPTLMTSVLLNYLFKNSMSKYSHILSYWGLGLQHMSLEGWGWGGGTPFSSQYQTPEVRFLTKLGNKGIGLLHSLVLNLAESNRKPTAVA